jgi:ABC-type multidrug transport system fused ATPase/permease subunit
MTSDARRIVHEDAEERRDAPLPGNARLSALGDLHALLRLLPHRWWTTPSLVVLGLLSSIAETMGVTMVILFFYSAAGDLKNAVGTAGAFGKAMTGFASRFPNAHTLALVVFLLIIARGLLAFGYNWIGGSVGARISEAARNEIHKQYLTVAYDFVQRQEQARLMDVLGTESWLIASAQESFTRLIINTCAILVFGLCLVTLSWKITVVAAAGTLLTSTALRLLSAPVRALGSQVKAVHQSLGERMLITLQGMRTIRAFAQEDAHHESFVEASAIARRAALELHRLTSILDPLTEIGYLAVLCVLIAGSKWLKADFTTTLTAVALLYRLQPHVKQFEYNLLYMAQLEPTLRSVREMLDRNDKTYLPDGEIAIDDIHADIRFENVSFAYSASPRRALDGVSFTLPAGKTTALIGVSGAGKTTVVNLLLRLYLPDSGRIVVDGRPMETLKRTGWLGLLAVAGQDVDLIEGTVQDNIRMSRAGATDAEVEDAATVAGISEVIAERTDGYANWIGAQGLSLSGGQRQRLGLARAILRDPRFLMLDEAMSALDRGLEDRVRSAISERFPHRMLLLITHRLETVLSADHVVCLDEGRVLEEGRPATLLGNPNSALVRLLNLRPPAPTQTADLSN